MTQHTKHTKHTPAPWFVNTNPPKFTGSMSSIIAIESGKPAEALAFCSPLNAANARLIAAAPELLAALEKVNRKPYRSEWMNEAAFQGAVKDYNEALAAIAKAKGQP